MTTIFYDFEATGVSRDADPVSIGLIAITPGIDAPSIHTFYAEFNDFNPDKADQWVKDNIITPLSGHDFEKDLQSISPRIELYKDFSLVTALEKIYTNPRFGALSTATVAGQLKEWLSNFDKIEFWADFDVIDKPMLIDLIADWDMNKTYKVGLPSYQLEMNYYDFYDIHTLFKDRGVNPDIDRESFAFSGYGLASTIDELNDLEITASKHDALYDAYVNWKCYEKLKGM